MRWITTLLAAIYVCAVPPASRAQNWPSKPITMVVSNGPGSAPDVMARLLASRMEPLLGQPVIVEDKPGGSNVIGAMAVKQAPADGYRLFFATSSALAANPFLTKDLPYDPLVDFTPVAMINIAHNYLLVHRDVPVKSVAELIAVDKSTPGSYSISIDGPRNLAGITGQALNLKAGTKFVLVSYPNIMNGVQDLMAGRVQAGIFPIAITQSAVDEGVLRPIAVTAIKRAAGHDDIPAVAETLPNFDFVGWFMVMAPKGVPADVIAKLNAALDKSMRDPQIVTMGPKFGYEYDAVGVGSPEKAGAYLKSQIEYWRTITRDLDIKPE